MWQHGQTYKNGSTDAIDDTMTRFDHVYWDSAVQSGIAYDKHYGWSNNNGPVFNLSNFNTNFTTNYTLNGLGQTASAAVNDGVAKTVAYIGHSFMDAPIALNMRDLLAAQQSLTSSYGNAGDWQYLHKVAICSQDAEQVLGTLILLIEDKTPGRRAYGTVWLRDQSNRTLVIALTGVVDHSLAAAQLREDKRLEREQQQKALAVRANQEAAAKWTATQKAWADWRTVLGVGAESHCGPVIALRGPMVEVANAGVALWFRREALYPVGARNGFGSLIACRPE